MTDWLLLFGVGFLLGVGVSLLMDVTVDSLKEWWRDN